MKQSLLFPGLFLAASTGCSLAAPINYGDFSDIPPGSVMYLDVTETANTPGDSGPVVGAPMISGNSLSFDPTSFEVAATGGIDPTDVQLNFTLMAAGRAPISSIELSASGVYSLQGSGSDATRVGYALSMASVTVLEVDDVQLASPVTLPCASSSSSDHLGNGQDTATPWSIGLSYDVSAALTQAGIAFSRGATKIQFALDTMLISIGDPNSSASISVDSFGVEVNPTPDPLPTLAITRSGAERSDGFVESGGARVSSPTVDGRNPVQLDRCAKRIAQPGGHPGHKRTDALSALQALDSRAPGSSNPACSGATGDPVPRRGGRAGPIGQGRRGRDRPSWRSRSLALGFHRPVPGIPPGARSCRRWSSSCSASSSRRARRSSGRSRKTTR